MFRSSVKVGRLLPGIQDDRPWYVVHYQIRRGGAHSAPLAHFETLEEALSAAVPLTGCLVPDWQPFLTHVSSSTLVHECPYDLVTARLVLEGAMA